MSMLYHFAMEKTRIRKTVIFAVATEAIMLDMNNNPKHLSTGLNHIPISIIIPLISLIVYYIKSW